MGFFRLLVPSNHHRNLQAGPSQSYRPAPHKQPNEFGSVRKQNLLFVVECRAPPHRHAVNPILVHQAPKRPLPQLVANGRVGFVHFLPVCTGILDEPQPNADNVPTRLG